MCQTGTEKSWFHQQIRKKKSWDHDAEQERFCKPNLIHGDTPVWFPFCCLKRNFLSPSLSHEYSHSHLQWLLGIPHNLQKRKGKVWWLLCLLISEERTDLTTCWKRNRSQSQSWPSSWWRANSSVSTSCGKKPKPAVAGETSRWETYGAAWSPYTACTMRWQCILSRGYTLQHSE